MRPIAADTSVLLPGLLSPAGLRRKLLTLLAYGGLNYYTRVGLDELGLLREQAERAGAQVAGVPVEALVERANDRKAALAERLPPLAPDDLILIGSRAVFDEVEAKIATQGPRMFKGHWSDGMPSHYRRQLETISGLVVPAA